MLKRDIHDDKPEHEIRVDAVGIGWIPLPPLVKGKIILNPMVKVLVDLPSYKRGAHLSRSYRTLRSMRGEEVFERPESLAERLLELHDYSRRAVVVLRAKGLLVDGDDYRRFKAFKKVVYERGSGALRRVVGYGFTTSNACPCALDTSLQLLGKPLTHIQRVLVEVYIKSRGRLPVEEEEFIAELSGVVQPSLKGFLNRPNEVEFIRRLVEKPMFVEDIVREVGNWLKSRLSGLGGVGVVKAVSLESIHEYNAEAMLKINL
ncbi:MAG: GTP cyclohydrolase I FolE2 [Thermogladius sp.]|nr:GTP cyclohydrolase I FolE2 [Thermogladius sp.]